MDDNLIGDLTRSLSNIPSRRDLLRGLAGAGLGLGTTCPLGGVEAKKKRRKKKTGKPNAFGCLNVGARCTKSGQCCSSICQGKKGKKRCRDHDTGGCPPGFTPDGCVSGPAVDIPCTTSRGVPGQCYTTTGNAGYCGATVRPPANFVCSDCTRDAECQALLGAGAACVLCQDDCGSPACVSPNP